MPFYFTEFLLHFHLKTCIVYHNQMEYLTCTNNIQMEYY